MKRKALIGLAMLVSLAAGSAVCSCGTVPIPPELPPMLEAWARAKAERLAACKAAGYQGREILVCLGDYAADRGTFACERVREAID